MSSADRPRRPDVTAVELVGGPEALELSLHDHDVRWAARYDEHRRRIEAALTAVPVQVEHIGSTAVPGLAAKPIVDVVVVVEDITAEEDYLDALLAAGYELRVREPGHRLVRTPARDVHVHVYQAGDPAVDAYLLLRDHLRVDAADRALYERTKRRLLEARWDDMNDYADAKTDVITAIRARAARVDRVGGTGEDDGPSVQRARCSSADPPAAPPCTAYGRPVRGEPRASDPVVTDAGSTDAGSAGRSVARVRVG